MESPVVLVMFVVMVMATFWLYLYCYGLYSLGRWIATKYRILPVRTLVAIGTVSALFSLPFFFLPINQIWRAAIGVTFFFTHSRLLEPGFGVEWRLVRRRTMSPSGIAPGTGYELGKNRYRAA